MGTKFGTLRQRQKIDKQIKEMDNIQSDPYLYGSLPDKKEFKARKEELAKQHQAISPTPLSSEERTTLLKRQEELEAFIKLPCPSIKKPDMPTRKEMWTPNSQTRGRHRTWENSVKNYTLDASGNPVKAKGGYGALMEWKDNQRRINGDEEEINPDIANTENLRSEKNNMGLIDAKSMTYGLTPAAKANYDDVFPDHPKTDIEKKLGEAYDRIVELERTALRRSAKSAGGMSRRGTRCSATKTNGNPCKALAILGETYCAQHKMQFAKEAKQDEVATA